MVQQSNIPTLTDAQVQKSLADFVSEAKRCAELGMGFAAMSTVFNVVLAVSEAVFGRGKDTELIKSFAQEMTAVSSWLWTTEEEAEIAIDELVAILAGIRNGFAHALSIPLIVSQYNTADEAMNSAQLAAWVSPGKELYFISVVDFVNDVEATVNKLSTINPNKPFDANPMGSLIEVPLPALRFTLQP